MVDFMIDKLVKELPSLPESAMQIEAVYKNPNSNFNDLVKIIEKDPLLTADILKATNSPLYGFTKEISTINRSVTLFGMSVIRGFALASIVKKSFKIDLSAYGLTTDEFSELSKLQSALASNWYTQVDKSLLPILVPSAFLSEIGKVLIGKALKDHNLATTFKTRIQTEDVWAVELDMVGYTASMISAMAFEHWRFEEDMVQSIRYSTQPLDNPHSTFLISKILHVVKTAIPLKPKLTLDSTQKSVELAKQYNLDSQKLQTIFDTFAQ